MAKLYEGTRDKLAYAITKLENMVDDFYLCDEDNPRFTPDADACEALSNDLSRLSELVYAFDELSTADWKLVSKYTKIADEFRAMKRYAR